MALIYRAHFAFSKSPRVNSKGLNTGAVFGFTNALLEILEKERPTHIGVAFESSTPTFRHEQFEAYKAQRDAQPEDISAGMPYIKKIIQGFDIPILKVDGFEADDVIGTLAHKAAQEGFEVYMMTPDKDYSQLVQKGVYLYKPSYMGKGVEIWGVPEVLARWNIERVEQVTDILGLQGDAVDNIPGIPGVGEKTAIKLIGEYGSVENIIANAGELKGKLKERVTEFADQAILSKQLATIDIDVPIAFQADAFCCSELNRDALAEVFEELEFRSLARRVLGVVAPDPPTKTRKKGKSAGQMDLFSASSAAEVDVAEEDGPDTLQLTGRDTIESVRHHYYLMDTPELRRTLVEHLKKQKEFCFDTETSGIDPIDAELVGMSFSWHPREAYYVPLPADQAEARAIADEFREVLEDERILKIGQNLKFDITVLNCYSIDVKGPLFDTMLAHYLLEPEMRHNMDVLAENYLNYQPVSIESLIGKRGKDQKTMREVPVKEVVEYAGEDADVTLQLKTVFAPRLKEQGYEKLMYEVECPLVPVLSDMEAAGVKIDPNALAELSQLLSENAAQIEKRIYEEAGETFNIGSPKQLGEILFDKLKIADKPKKTKSGQYATNEKVLSSFVSEHAIVRDILDYRELQKLRSTYVDALPQLIHTSTGRVHTSFNQAVTATGRLSSTNPNLQNIPIRTEQGREIRKAFVPRDQDHVIFAADYSQIELRIMADFSGDESMIEAFRKGLDIHTNTAAKVYGVALDEVTPEMRRNAKTVNFAIIYGVSAFGLAQRLYLSRQEASDIIKSYFKEFAAVKAYMDSAIEKARQDEYVSTLLGRRRYLPDINSRNQTMRGFAERNAINAPIQGTAADMIKIAMIRIHDWMKKEKLQSRMILQVHDELVFDAHRDEIDVLKTHVTEFMKNALPLSVPMEIGVGVGDNWLEAH